MQAGARVDRVAPDRPGGATLWFMVLLLLACTPHTVDSPVELVDSEVVPPEPDPQPPTAPGALGLSPAAPTTLDALLLSVETPASDPDGLVVDYRVRWTQDGQPRPDLDDAWAVLPEHTARGQLWAVAVHAVDDAGLEGEPASASVTVVNRAPDAPQVRVLPEQPVAGVDALSCEVEGADADGDALVVERSWSKDGEAWGPDAPDPGLTEIGEVWGCTARVGDGEAWSDEASASVTVRGGLPPDFSLDDVNPTSATYGEAVSPRDYLEMVSGWYFGHAT